MDFGTEDIRNSMKKTHNLKKKEGFALRTNPMGKRKRPSNPINVSIGPTYRRGGKNLICAAVLTCGLNLLERRKLLTEKNKKRTSREKVLSQI